MDFIRLKSNKGFTYIEIMLAIVLLSLIVLPYLNILSEGMRIIKINERKEIALMLAVQQIESLKAERFVNLKNKPEEFIHKNNGSKYRIKIDISKVNSEVKRVKVTVYSEKTTKSGVRLITKITDNHQTEED